MATTTNLSNILFPVYIIPTTDLIHDGDRTLYKGQFCYYLITYNGEGTLGRKRLIVPEQMLRDYNGFSVKLAPFKIALTSFVEVLRRNKPKHLFIDSNGYIFSIPKSKYAKTIVKPISKMELDPNFTYVYVLGTTYPYKTTLQNEAAKYVNLLEYLPNVFLVLELLTKEDYDAGRYTKLKKV